MNRQYQRNPNIYQQQPQAQPTYRQPRNNQNYMRGQPQPQMRQPNMTPNVPRGANKRNQALEKQSMRKKQEINGVMGKVIAFLAMVGGGLVLLKFPTLKGLVVVAGVGGISYAVYQIVSGKKSANEVSKQTVEGASSILGKAFGGISNAVTNLANSRDAELDKYDDGEDYYQHIESNQPMGGVSNNQYPNMQQPMQRRSSAVGTYYDPNQGQINPNMMRNNQAPSMGMAQQRQPQQQQQRQPQQNNPRFVRNVTYSGQSQTGNLAEAVQDDPSMLFDRELTENNIVFPETSSNRTLPYETNQREHLNNQYVQQQMRQPTNNEFMELEFEKGNNKDQKYRTLTTIEATGRRYYKFNGLDLVELEEPIERPRNLEQTQVNNNPKIAVFGKYIECIQDENGNIQVYSDLNVEGSHFKEIQLKASSSSNQALNLELNGADILVLQDLKVENISGICKELTVRPSNNSTGLSWDTGNNRNQTLEQEERLKQKRKQEEMQRMEMEKKKREEEERLRKEASNLGLDDYTLEPSSGDYLTNEDLVYNTSKNTDWGLGGLDIDAEISYEDFDTPQPIDNQELDLSGFETNFG